MRLIDADALFDKVEALYKVSKGVVRTNYKETIDLICDATTVDAAPVVHGKWVPHKIEGYENMLSIAEDVCSVCGQDFLEIRETGCIWNYCPNCGARMDGGSE